MSALPSTLDADIVSVDHYHVAGIRITVYGRANVQASARKVDCLWLLHRRKGDQSQMEPFAKRTIRAWTARTAAAERGLLAVVLDHRNHGARLVDERANASWKEGNETHALDLFSVYQGTAADVSLLMDYIDACVFPAGDLSIDTHMVIGASLGGHSAWQLAMSEPRARDVICVIACPDFCRLMTYRAVRSGLIETDADLLGTRHLPRHMHGPLVKHDPYARLVHHKSPHAEGCFDGKRIMCLSGGADTLVPHAVGQTFRDWFGSNLSECRTSLQDVIDDQAGHKFTPKMEDEAERFIVECIERRLVPEDWKVRGIVTTHI